MENALGTRTTCNANPARSHYQELAALNFIRVFLKHGIEVCNFGVQGSSWKSEENDSGMGTFLVKDQLAEIPVSDDQHAFLFPRDGQDILIGKTRRIIARDGLHVMAELEKVRNKSKVGALVEQESHRVASERAPFGGFGKTSSPVTISFA